MPEPIAPQSTLNREWWEWENWSFSSKIAEALFASWATDASPDDNVRWHTGRKPWDVKSDSLSVDVKDAFVQTARPTPGPLQRCLGFMGTKRGPGAEARDSVTHYGLVVRNLHDHTDSIQVHQNGTATITADATCRIFLVPREVINTFNAKCTNDWNQGSGRNRYLPLAEATQYLVFDNRRESTVAADLADDLIGELTGVAEAAWRAEDGLRSDCIDAVLAALLDRWASPTAEERAALFDLTYSTYSSTKGGHGPSLAAAVRALAVAAATGQDQSVLQSLASPSTYEDTEESE